jgi:ribonuclease E
VAEVQEPEVAASEVQEPFAPPAPPRVVTRTRRGAASRPAGPPAALSTDGVAPEHDGVEHVPVKKKGSRKR